MLTKSCFYICVRRKPAPMYFARVLRESWVSYSTAHNNLKQMHFASILVKIDNPEG